MCCCLYSAGDKAVRKFYASVIEDHLNGVYVSISFPIEIREERSIDHESSNYVLPAWFKAQSPVNKYNIVFTDICLPVCSDCVQRKLIIVSHAFWLQMWITLPKHCAYDGAYGRFRKGLYHVAMIFSVLYLCDMQVLCKPLKQTQSSKLSKVNRFSSRISKIGWTKALKLRCYLRNRE